MNKIEYHEGDRVKYWGDYAGCYRGTVRKVKSKTLVIDLAWQKSKIVHKSSVTLEARDKLPPTATA